VLPRAAVGRYEALRVKRTIFLRTHPVFFAEAPDAPIHDVRGRNHGCRARGEIAVSFAFQIIPTKTRFDGSSDKREPIEPARYNGTVAAAGSHSASRPSDP
jgi:hypothetical protein